MQTTLDAFLPNIKNHLGAETILSIDKIQSLWSDYGAIYRLSLKGAQESQIVVKCIAFLENTEHPRGWATSHSHQRKLKSYLVENYWYKNYASTLPDTVKVPSLLYSEHRATAQVLVLEDLSINYPNLKSSCSLQEAKTVVQWLARFHAHFLNSNADGLWPIASYWHLATRQDEWNVMPDSLLKTQASELDKALNRAKYQTIIHGDAKVANFCFSDNCKVAAVDFQYTGRGIGVKDLAYFLGSCLTGNKCARYEDSLLDYYFDQLALAIIGLTPTEKKALEKEWRSLYPVAWADFNRFLMGWMPEHHKLHNHALSKNQKALVYLDSVRKE